MNRILLIGPTGQVGWELQRSLMPLGEVIPSGRTACDPHLRMDCTDPASVQRIIRDIHPTLIVNAAAYTAVDQAEKEPDLAMVVNGVTPGVMAETAKAIGAGLVHYSTDYVFRGDNPKPQTETDIADPQNVYGRTKLAGEEAIRAVGIPYLIFRTSWVYGLKGQNFLLTMLRLAKEREEIRVVDDQFGAPTWSRMIAEVTAQILAQGVRDFPKFCEQHQGLYHLTASGQTTWYDFTKAILLLDPNVQTHQVRHVIAIPTEDYPLPAKRPTYSVLDGSKLLATFGMQLPDWQKSLELVWL
jgi:dTDP-4-dehydrorhamnose reductase